MKRVYKIFVLLFCATNIAAQVPSKTIPYFTFKRLNKTVFSNKDLEQGKLLFFVFFDADCDHCQHAIQYISQHNQEFRKSAIYLITLDSVKAITSFMAKYGSNLKGKKNVTLLQDPNYEFMFKFKPRKYPSMFLYSAKGELIMYDDNEQNLPRFSKEINKAVK